MSKEQCIDTIESSERLFANQITWNTWIKSGVRLFVDDLRKLLDVPLIWQRRAHDRHQLRQMSTHIMKDIGIEWTEVDCESRKPFWRA